MKWSNSGGEAAALCEWRREEALCSQGAPALLRGDMRLLIWRAHTNTRTRSAAALCVMQGSRPVAADLLHMHMWWQPDRVHHCRLKTHESLGSGVLMRILRQWWRTRPRTGRFSISKLWWVSDEVIDDGFSNVGFCGCLCGWRMELQLVTPLCPASNRTIPVQFIYRR